MRILKTLWKWLAASIASSQPYAAREGIDPRKNAELLFSKEKKDDTNVEEHNSNK